MKYLEYSELTDELKQAVIRKYHDQPPAFFLKSSFPITKTGKLASNRIAGVSRAGVKELEIQWEEMKNFGLTGPVNLEKGDYHHLKTTKFALNRENS